MSGEGLVANASGQTPALARAEHGKGLAEGGYSIIHIACAADEGYVPHAAAMMQSVLGHIAAPEVRFHFLHAPGLQPAMLIALDRMVAARGATLCCHAVPDGWVAGLPEMGRISRVMWYRVFLPQLLPEVERVIYLDCDTLAMDSLRPLFELTLDGCGLAAVSNVFEAGREGHAREIGLSRPSDYFNSGVLVLDLPAWRRLGCTERLLARARSGGLLFPDQDALNLEFQGQWHALDPRWNCQNSLYFFPHAAQVFSVGAVLAATRAPAILHFEGGELAKPWHYLCKHPHRAVYFEATDPDTVAGGSDRRTYVAQPPS